jgi:hypothetical protein
MGHATDSVSSSKNFQVPMLAADGSNWIIWKRQTLTTLSAHKGVKRHIDGNARRPANLPKYPSGHTLTKIKNEEYDELERRWDEYNQREGIIKSQILTTVSESVTLEIQDEDEAHEIWEKLCNKHEDKALSVRVDLRRRIYALKCEDESNIRTHIHTLKSMQERLNGMGEKIEDRDFLAVMLASLPKSYRPLISTLDTKQNGTQEYHFPNRHRSSPR